jgi:hypothetical protein
VELAVVLPVVLLLILGMVNVGFLLHVYSSLTHAAWEGARAGATLDNPSEGDNEIRGAVLDALRGLDTSRLRLEISPSQDEPPRDQPGPEPRGRPLSVSVSLPSTVQLPFPVEVWLRASAVSRMEYQNP